jgi:YVTN family beta-propeller protein
MVHLAVVYGTFCAVLLSQFNCESAWAQSVPLYSITQSIALGAPDRWDYLTFDHDSGRVFVAHGDRVTVINGRDGSVLGQVPGFPGGTHGVAIASRAKRGYSDDGKAGTATSFDLETLKPLRTTKTGSGADAVIFDPSSGHVFVINGGGESVSVIDPVKDTSLATINVGGDLEFGAADGNGKLYVNGAEKREIVRIDTSTNRIDARWPIATCERPHGIAVDPSTRRLFVTCVNNILVVVDADNGAVITTLPIGSRTDAAAFDPKRKLIFSSNGDGTLTVIAEKGPNTFVVVGNVATEVGARTMALDAESGRIYLVTADSTVNDKADASDTRRRYTVKPGTARLLFLDPAQ